MSERTGFASWAIVELFGHQKIAGWCTEEPLAGSGLLRVDVPAYGTREAFTRYYGNGAIYALTPCTEEVVMLALPHLFVAPIPVYIPEQRQLTAGAQPAKADVVDAEDDDDDLEPTVRCEVCGAPVTDDAIGQPYEDATLCAKCIPEAQAELERAVAAGELVEDPHEPGMFVPPEDLTEG